MNFIETILQYASMAVIVFGAGIAISGLLDMSTGKSQHNAGKQDEGMSKIVGGGTVIAIGVFLVPQLSSLFTV